MFVVMALRLSFVVFLIIIFRLSSKLSPNTDYEMGIYNNSLGTGNLIGRADSVGSAAVIVLI